MRQSQSAISLQPNESTWQASVWNTGITSSIQPGPHRCEPEVQKSANSDVKAAGQQFNSEYSQLSPPLQRDVIHM